MGRESREWIRWVGCCLVIAAVGLAGQVARAADTKRPRRIAIVPLKNLRPDTDTNWIGAGAAETLTTKLGELPDLITVERTRISKIIEERRLQAALGDVATAVKVGKIVGAERLLIGSYAKMGANIQFNVRVVDVATGVVLNRASVVRPEAKMFDALYALAEAVIESFKKKGVVVDNRPAVVAAPRAEHVILTAEQARKLKKLGTTSSAAYRAFCQGCDAADLKEKIRWHTKAITLDRRYAWAYNNRGIAYRKTGEYERAIRDFDRAIELDPQYALAYGNRGVAYREKGEYDRAIRDCDSAIKLDPTCAGAYNNRGTAYANKGEYDRAIRDHNRAIELDPEHAEAYTNRGIAYGRKRELDRSIRDYDRAIELNPRHADTYYNRGNAYCKKSLYDRAIRDFDRAIELNPKHADACMSRGSTYGRKGDYGRAIRDFDRAVELNPKHPEAYHNRAVAYYRKRNYTKAWADVGVCQRLGGKVNPKLLAALRKVSGRDE